MGSLLCQFKRGDEKERFLVLLLPVNDRMNRAKILLTEENIGQGARATRGKESGFVRISLDFAP